MTPRHQQEQQKSRRRHILKRSGRRAADVGADIPPPAGESASGADETVEAPSSSAVEPESGAIEETSAVDTVEPPVAETDVESDVPVKPVETVEPAETEAPVETDEPAVPDVPAETVGAAPQRRGGGTAAKVFAFGVLPFLAVVLAVAVG